MADESAIRIGALVPLTRPGWVDAGRRLLAEAPSFVAFEGYDTVAVLAEMLSSHGGERARIAGAWASVAVEGTRGQIRFSRMPGISVWQWAWPPVQVVARDAREPGRFRVLRAA